MKAAPCGDNAECLNRILRIECASNSCPAKDKCENRRFQKRVYPPMEVCGVLRITHNIFPKGHPENETKGSEEASLINYLINGDISTTYIR